MHVWDSVGKGQIRFDTPLGEDAVAHIVENNHLQAALANRVAQAPQIAIYNRARVREIGNSTTGGPRPWPLVHLEDGRTIESRLLVGADGGNSSVRTFAGIDSIGWDYAQKGLVATLEIQANGTGNATAWQRFLPSGPIALLPLDATHSSLVWTVPPNLAAKLTSLPPASFAHLVNAALTSPWEDVKFLCSQIGDAGEPLLDFEAEMTWGQTRPDAIHEARRDPRPPRVISVRDASRAGFPLKLRNSEAYVKSRVALIGDAAHTIHPLAGQGLNLGLADAERLAAVIAEGITVGQDIGHVHLLENYARGRYLPNLAMLKGVDAIGKLFGTESGAVATVRSLGLDLVDRLTPVKTKIMDFAGRNSR
ncbi:putative ubiquinone biosynthesis monooxygenase [Thoreauomyces humboldtii]|nr:putative ubiquinone biosynthesis monooxygenase [Thoreauomyces humboldtii]